jgi:hypothetical protein
MDIPNEIWDHQNPAMSLAVAFFFCTPTHKPIQQPLYINIMLERGSQGWEFANYDGVTVGCGRPLWCGMCSVAASSSFFPPPAPESARRATRRGGGNCGDDGGGEALLLACRSQFLGPFWRYLFCRGLSTELSFFEGISSVVDCPQSFPFCELEVVANLVLR